MNKRICVIVRTALSGALGGLFFFSQHPVNAQPAVQEHCQVSLQEEAKICNVQVLTGKDGYPIVRVGYAHSGNSYYSIATYAEGQIGGGELKHVPQKEGVVELEVTRPMEPVRAMVTRKLFVAMWRMSKVVMTKSVDHLVEWPESGAYYSSRSEARKTDEQRYKEAVSLIDEGAVGGLGAARRMLERVLLNEPGNVPALIEMARVAMKTNWSPEGLRQAEKYLDAALSFDAANANAKVLRGYVYTHQRRRKEAERDFVDAAAVGTGNLWLWANWGELFAMQGMDEAAIEKYRRAVSGARTYDTYDRARLDAYEKLFRLLEKGQKYEELDALHQRRVTEFPKTPCLRTEQAMARLARQADPNEVIAIAKSAMDDGCNTGLARSVLGTAYYVAWASQPQDQRARLLAQARIFLPDGPWVFFALARNDATASVIPKVVSNGSPIDVKDSDKFTALAHALSRGEVDAARRLLRSGAKPSELVSEEQYPVALIPLMNQSAPGVKLMQGAGVNYAKLRWRGLSGVEMAKRMGNTEILRLVERGAAAPI